MVIIETTNNSFTCDNAGYLPTMVIIETMNVFYLW